MQRVSVVSIVCRGMNRAYPNCKVQETNLLNHLRRFADPLNIYRLLEKFKKLWNLNQ